MTFEVRKSRTDKFNQCSAESDDLCGRGEKTDELLGQESDVEQNLGERCRYRNNHCKSQDLSHLGFSKSTVASRNKHASQPASRHSRNDSNISILQTDHVEQDSDLLAEKVRYAIRRKREAQSLQTSGEGQKVKKLFRRFQSNVSPSKLSTKSSVETSSCSSWYSERDGLGYSGKPRKGLNRIRNTQKARPQRPRSELKTEREMRLVALPSHQIRSASDNAKRNSVNVETRSRHRENISPNKIQHSNAIQNDLVQWPTGASLETSGVDKTQNKTGSEYSTISCEISKENAIPELPQLDCIAQKETSAITYENQKNDQYLKSVRPQDSPSPDKRPIVTKGGDDGNQDGTLKDHEGYKTCPSANLQTSMNSNITEAVKKKTILKGSGKTRGHSPCRTFKHTAGDRKVSNSYQKRREKIPRDSPNEPVNNAFCGSVRNSDSQNVAKSDREGILSMQGQRQCRVRRAGGNDSYGALSSQIQSVIEYQALLSENIQYLTSQLDQLISQLPQGCIMADMLDPSRGKHREASGHKRSSKVGDIQQDYNLVDGNLDSLPSPSIPSKAHKSEQTEDVRRANSTPNENKAKLGKELSPRDLSPARSNCIHDLLVEDLGQGSRVNQSHPHSCKPFLRRSWRAGGSKDSTPVVDGQNMPEFCALSGTGGQELSVCPQKMEELFEEMEVWKAKLAMTATEDKGFTPDNVFDGSDLHDCGEAKRLGSERRLAGDMNWSSCVKSSQISELSCEKNSEPLESPSVKNSEPAVSYCLKSSDTSEFSCVNSPELSALSCVKNSEPQESSSVKNSEISELSLPNDQGDGYNRLCRRNPGGRIGGKERVPHDKTPTLDKTSGFKVTIAHVVLLLVVVVFEFLVQEALTLSSKTS